MTTKAAPVLTFVIAYVPAGKVVFPALKSDILCPSLELFAALES
jgi:hypothetical protein